MTIQEITTQLVKKLNSQNIATARLDVIVLVCDALEKDKSWILAHPDFELNSKIATKLQLQIEKRAKHVPLAYIRGKSEFYGREFLVTPDTLQPRPETETMIDILKKLVLPEVVALADIGTGSGCIAITCSKELPYFSIYATEINEAALEVAKKNAMKLKAQIQFYRGNLLEPLKGKNLDILLCNLPYVPDSHTINEAAMQEPKIAIFGGEDGLQLYRELFGQISERKQRPKYILAESLPFQHKELAAIAKAAGYKQISEEDFIQVFAHQ